MQQTSISTKEQYQAQSIDSELKELLTSDTALDLHNVRADKSSWTIYHDFSTGIPRPYIPKTLRLKIFDLTHRLSHHSGKITSEEIRMRFG